MHESAELARTSARKAWVPPGREIRVRRRRIPGGMLYVGTGLPAVSFPEVEPALIDPALPVGEDRVPESSRVVLPFWPSYSTIPSACRAAYLRWLEGGRRDPDVDMGYVSLFFFGLERRVLHDAELLPEAHEELPAIAEEVERLLSLYGDSPTFPTHAGQLLDIVRWKAGGKWPATPPLSRRGTEPPLALRVAAGRAALAGEPLSAAWALSWALCDPATQLPAPAARCPRELHELFRRRYAARFGEGMRLKPGEKRIEIHYITESDSFSDPIEISTDLPDVVSMVAPSRRLRDLLAECCDALTPYSRFLGRSDRRSDTLLGATLLPVEFFEAMAPKEFLELSARIEERLGAGEHATFPAADLLERSVPGESGRRSTRTALAAARILARAGFGMEPDPRFGGEVPTPEDEIVVFRLDPEENPWRLSPAFTLAASLLKLGVAVATADSAVSREQKRHLSGYLHAGLRLRASERRRLAARLEYLLIKPRRFLGGVRKRLEALDDGERRQVGRFLVQVAWADGEVDPEEVKVLANAYRLLGQDPGAVHEDIHDARATAPDFGPVPVQAAESRRSGYTIPAPPPDRLEASASSGDDSEDTVRLDRAAIDRKLEETAAVSALLSKIFAEDEPVRGPAGAAEEGGIHGLDLHHTTFLKSLGKRREWSRAQYDELARSLGLLSAGALDLVNDVAFEVAGAPLTEGEDPIEIDLDVHRELTS